MAPCGKKTTSGRMLGFVIFFPQLAHVVNRGVRRREEPSLRCTDCVAGGVIGGLRGVDNPTLWGLGQRPRIFGFGPYIRLGGPTMVFCMIFAHGFGCDGFWSMVLDASACINMYYNIEGNIMKIKAGSLGFVI